MRRCLPGDCGCGLDTRQRRKSQGLPKPSPESPQDPADSLSSFHAKEPKICPASPRIPCGRISLGPFRVACYAARQMGETPVTGEHVRKATLAKVERHNLYETKLREIIEEGTLLVDTSGSRVGQVNGLSVLEIGGYMFGKP